MDDLHQAFKGDITEWHKFLLARQAVETKYEWKRWCKELPFINFPADWEVKIIPPFSGAITRFIIRHKERPNKTVSVYFDGYAELGVMNQPYFEAYPIGPDVGRYYMDEVELMLKEIEEELSK